MSLAPFLSMGHRRQPALAEARHQRHAWAPMDGIRIDGVHPVPGRAHAMPASAVRLHLAAHGRRRISTRRSVRETPGSPRAHVRRAQHPEKFQS